MLTSGDFDYIAKLVRDDAGITLEKGKEYLVQSRVEPVAKNLGFSTIADFVVHLRQTSNLENRRKVVESITTHETSFFRDQEPFEIIRTKVLPELIALRRDLKELTIWCGAASTGQEPYSLCMLLREHFPELLQWKLRFIATDVSRPILDKARAGIFNQIEVNRGLPVRLLAKYFTKNGQEWAIKPEIRQMVEFSELNLLLPFNSVPKCDLVMLRNVLIYFDVETKRQILGKLFNILKPQGWLFLGTADTTLNLCDKFERVTFQRTSCYRREK